MTRPTEIECKDCGATVEVKSRGRVPERCDDCRAASRKADEGKAEEPSSPPVGDPDAPQPDEEQAAGGDGTAPAHVPAAKGIEGPAGDGWPKRVAPRSWVDQKGRRYTDLARARAGAEECRGG